MSFKLALFCLLALTAHVSAEHFAEITYKNSISGKDSSFTCMKSTFGGDFPIVSEKIDFVRLLPGNENGCETISQNINGKAVIVERGSCFFGIKANNVQAKGGKMMILVNDGDFIEEMHMSDRAGLNKAPTIPSCMVSSSEGAVIKHNMDEGSFKDVSIVSSDYVKVMTPMATDVSYKVGQKVDIEFMVSNSVAAVDIYLIEGDIELHNDHDISDDMLIVKGKLVEFGSTGVPKKNTFKWTVPNGLSGSNHYMFMIRDSNDSDNKFGKSLVYFRIHGGEELAINLNSGLTGNKESLFQGDSWTLDYTIVGNIPMIAYELFAIETYTPEGDVSPTTVVRRVPTGDQSKCTKLYNLPSSASQTERQSLLLECIGGTQSTRDGKITISTPHNYDVSNKKFFLKLHGYNEKK